ncbi:unnamed protein product, partial [Rotaria magnacalcarata]
KSILALGLYLFDVEFNSVQPRHASIHRQSMDSADRWKSIQCVKVTLTDIEFNSIYPGPVQSHRQRMNGTGICVEYL